MICEICKKPMRKIDSNLICANGHTIQNAEEVAGDECYTQSARSRVLKVKKKEMLKHETVQKSVGALIMIRSLFHEAMEHFDIKSDWVYKNYTALGTLYFRKDSPNLLLFKKDNTVHFSINKNSEERDPSCSNDESHMKESLYNPNFKKVRFIPKIQLNSIENELEIDDNEKLNENSMQMAIYGTPCSQNKESFDLNSKKQSDTENENQKIQIKFDPTVKTLIKQKTIDRFEIFNNRKCCIRRKARFVTVADFESNKKNKMIKRYLDMSIKDRELIEKEEKKIAFSYDSPFESKIEFEDPFYLNHFVVLVYMAKRIEVEKEGGIYLFSDFKKDLKRFNPRLRLLELYKRLNILNGAWDSATAECNVYDIKVFSSYLSALVSPCTFKRFSNSISKSHPSGIITRREWDVKHNFRVVFKRDIETYKKYFKAICGHLGVEITSRIMFYFEKYVYSSVEDTVFIPEIEFSLFIAIYFSDLDSFEGSYLEDKILSYLSYNRFIFYKLIDEKIDFLNDVLSPEQYIATKVRNNRKNFSWLRSSIWLIDLYKKSVDKHNN